MASAVNQNSPELNNVEPKIVFFGGGSALKSLSKRLKLETRNTVHVLTAFDSGGSTGALRRVFDMPGIGDARSRMLALANNETPENIATERCLSHRLAKDNPSARRELDLFVDAKHPLIAALSEPLRTKFTANIAGLLRRLPSDFDFADGCIGNFVLVGQWLASGRGWNEVLEAFARDIDVWGSVRLVVEDPLHLVAIDAGGNSTFGQHTITAADWTTNPIRALKFLRSEDEYAEPSIDIACSNLIRDADLVCYPPGSFWTSLVASLKPTGIGAAIAASSARKVYIPNIGVDPESFGMDLPSRVDALTATLLEPCTTSEPPSKLLTEILLDSQTFAALTVAELDYFRSRGIQLDSIGMDAGCAAYDVDALSEKLLQMARAG